MVGNAASGNAFIAWIDTRPERRDENGEMNKPYERPTLVKRDRLVARAAQIIASGVVLGE
jgi:hypothetical protein